MKIEVVHQWNDLLDLFLPEQQDIYFREEYVRLYERPQEQATCFICRDGDNIFLFPYLLRKCDQADPGYFDFETAYGYGGPICNTTDENFIKSAWAQFADYAKANNYVAGFIRFHPLFQNDKYFDSVGTLLLDRHTVAVNLYGSEDEIWQSEIHTKNRNVIKHGIKDGLTFIADYKYEYLSQFIELYNSTMNKLSADSFYYFDYSYYENLRQSCPGSFVGVVKLGDRLIAAALFFYNAPYGHYHLAGSDPEYLKLAPNNFLLWNAAKELRRHGVLLFHLGGGTNSDENNSLLQFKQKFSKHLYDFKIGKLIFNSPVYDSLCEEWEGIHPDRKEAYKHILLKYKY